LKVPADEEIKEASILARFFLKKKEEASFNSLSLTSKAKHSDYFGAIEIDTLNSAVAEF